MQLTVYSCITGGISDSLDLLFESKPAVTNPEDVRFVLFTDRIRPGLRDGKYITWEVRQPCWTHTNARRTARYHKLNAHLVLPDTEYSLWYDGDMELLPDTDLQALVTRYLGSCDLATFRHPERCCIYQELEACIRLKKDDPQVMRKQVARYQAEGYPTYNGLVETGCVCRRHNEAVRVFNTAWWRELSGGSLRDQLSFNYVAWKLNFPWGVMDGRRDHSPYFKFHPHK